MKVLVLKANYFPVCGASRLLETYLPHHDPARLQPVLVEVRTAGRPSSVHFSATALAGLEHAVIPWHGARRAGPAVAALRRLIRENHIDAVNSHDMRCDLLCRLAGGRRGLGVPWVAHVHGFVGKDGSARIRLFEAIDRFCLRAADAVFVGSARAEHDVRRHLPARVPMRLLPNAIDPRSVEAAPARAAALRQNLALPPGAFLIGMHARLHRAKGHHLLAEAVLRCRTPDVHALLLGYGDELANLRALAAAPAAAGRIHVPGEQPPADVLAAVAGLDLYAFASLRESLPLSVLEAMLLARPIVATAVGDLPQALAGAGVLVPPGDVAALAAAIDDLAADPGRRLTLGEAARRRAKDHYAPERLARAMEDAFADLLRKDTA